MLAALSQHNVLSKTTIILTAKHGQSPIDPNKYLKVSPSIIKNIVNSVQADWPRPRWTMWR